MTYKAETWFRSDSPGLIHNLRQGPVRLEADVTVLIGNMNETMPPEELQRLTDALILLLNMRYSSQNADFVDSIRHATDSEQILKGGYTEEVSILRKLLGV